MAPVTTYANGKPFAWSYSKLKNFAACPKKHWHVDIVKNAKEEESEILAWGNEVHKQLAARLKNKQPLPSTMVEFERHAAGIEKIPGTLLVEQKFGLTEQFAPCGYFDRNIWHRGVGDVVLINGVRSIAIDWKLGKILEDSIQLGLMAMCIFAQYPAVQQVDTIFMWLKDDAKTRETFTRDMIPGFWAALMPRINEYKAAVLMQEFPAKPGGLCRKWCPVDVCPYHGVGG
jgi:hypothetical protein